MPNVGDSPTFIFLGNKAYLLMQLGVRSPWHSPFCLGTSFQMSLDEACYLAQPVMILEDGRNRKVQSWVALG